MFEKLQIGEKIHDASRQPILAGACLGGLPENPKILVAIAIS